MKAFAIDAFDFCRLKEHAEGEVAVAELARLVQECADQSGLLRWSLRGSSDQFGYPRLDLSVSGSVQLMCQRCLLPFQHDVATRSALVLAQDEAGADEIEELLADDAVDVIVGSRQMDVMALIEDEALLALPPAPRHDICPDAVAVERLEGVKKPSPFAVLKDLKR